MNIHQYLERIDFNANPNTDLMTLNRLHQSHVTTVPFENLDIHLKRKILLEKDHLFEKVVASCRGGFCYELNYLFHSLLEELGFSVKIISARIFDDNKIGPEYDHMALVVDLNEDYWLADVGFGDLFVTPLKINYESEQYDGRNYFLIEKLEGESFLLSMSSDGKDYVKKYQFNLIEHAISQFCEQSILKQTSPDSYFVKNKIVTLAVDQGRKTIFNSKFIRKSNNDKTELEIVNQEHETTLLKEQFNISL